MSIFYFAYGSNLCDARVTGRAPGAAALWPAWLPGFELRWHKRGLDGSGKCSVLPSTSSTSVVHGVLYRLPLGSKPKLDQVEGLGIGYTEATVRVHGDSCVSEALTYVASSTHIDESLQPYSWYKRLVVAGAAAQGLPPDYVDSLRAVETWPDPDVEREARHLADLPCDRSM